MNNITLQRTAFRFERIVDEKSERCIVWMVYYVHQGEGGRIVVYKNGVQDYVEEMSLEPATMENAATHVHSDAKLTECKFTFMEKQLKAVTITVHYIKHLFVGWRIFSYREVEQLKCKERAEEKPTLENARIFLRESMVSL